MELFLEYDVERLSRYDAVADNAGKINIESHPNALFLSFTDVGYFNYCVCFDPDNLPDVVERAVSFYGDRQIRHHRLLIDEALYAEEHYDFLSEQGYTLKERLRVVSAPADRPGRGPELPSLGLDPVSEESLPAFTADYLTGFESEQKNLAPVVTNFRQLLGSRGISLYHVTDSGRPVGIAVLYDKGNNYFLAGGAILPDHRNKGYHTHALETRLDWCYRQKAKNVYSWAYDNSASYRNMLKVGLVPYKSFRVYER
ncbi:GNAT family N-acetyltransferase [Larkinella soli]|uniref:GNAT family N-acetyltransferase n=1 Tax=Larkinella soli TaxID=1770527 RepID=UPI0013E2C8BD|nr:GNAT family N-acetyltransferase [Larkinella soli]